MVGIGNLDVGFKLRKLTILDIGREVVDLDTGDIPDITAGLGHGRLDGILPVMGGFPH